MFCLASQSTKFLTHQTISLQLGYMLSRRKRVRDLQQVKIALPTQQSQLIEQIPKPSYLALREQISKLNWQFMQFDKLCALPQKTLDLINIQIKKDKFNVDDSEFYAYSSTQLSQHTNNGEVQSKLNPYYLRLYHLLMNHFQQYDQISHNIPAKQYYMNEMYIMDLVKNTKLKEVIQYFINHINQPNKLDIVAQPSFVKHLLSIKRELMLQGVHFPTAQPRRKKKQQIKKQSANEQKKDEPSNIQYDQQAQVMQQKEQQDLEKTQQNNSKIYEYIRHSLKDSKLNVKILKILGYQYQFWVDVKHNRSKNGVQEDYIIQQRQIENPNQSILLKKQFPTIKVKYIVHKKKRKNYSMHFCIKSLLLVNIEGTLKNIKIEWRGPSNSYKQNMQDTSFIIIDYENLMSGNPTIKPIFFF